MQATPSISVSSSGLITASSTQSEGYVTSGTKSSTQQLTTQAAKTVTPGRSSQTAVASGRYTTGNITVAGDSNLVASNIKSGVNIFGVRGTYSGVLPTTYEATDSDFSYSTSTTYSNYGHIQFTLPVTPSSIIAFWLQTRWTPDLSTAASTYAFYPAHSDTLYNDPGLGSYRASCFAGHIDNPNRYSIGSIGFDISGRILRLYNTSWDEFFDQNTVRDVLLDYAVITYIA